MLGEHGKRWNHTTTIVLPKPLQKQAFKQLHDASTAGHLGINAKSSRDFTDATTLRTSEDGALAVTYVHPEKGHSVNLEPMGQYNVGMPMECVALDILGSLLLSDSGNQYLLIVVDYFTKWPEAYALPKLIFYWEDQHKKSQVLQLPMQSIYNRHWKQCTSLRGQT